MSPFQGDRDEGGEEKAGETISRPGLCIACTVPVSQLYHCCSLQGNPRNVDYIQLPVFSLHPSHTGMHSLTSQSFNGYMLLDGPVHLHGTRNVWQLPLLSYGQRRQLDTKNSYTSAILHGLPHRPPCTAATQKLQVSPC